MHLVERHHYRLRPLRLLCLPNCTSIFNLLCCVCILFFVFIPSTLRWTRFIFNNVLIIFIEFIVAVLLLVLFIIFGILEKADGLQKYMLVFKFLLYPVLYLTEFIDEYCQIEFKKHKFPQNLNSKKIKCDNHLRIQSLKVEVHCLYPVLSR